MAQIVGGFSASHAPGQVTRRSEAGEQGARFFAALEQATTALKRAEPDVVLFCSGEHFTNFYPNLFPQNTIGIGEAHVGPSENWMPFQKASIPGHPELGLHLAQHLLESGFDPSVSNELLLDHGVMTIYHAISAEMDVPLVPIIQNTMVGPRMPLARNYAFGQALRRGIERFPGDLRVAAVGAGGLSHSIGTGDDGLIDQEFDRWFLDRLVGNEMSDIIAVKDDELSEAGNGAHEVRSWITVHGILEEYSSSILGYEAVDAWITGMAVLNYNN